VDISFLENDMKRNKKTALTMALGSAIAVGLTSAAAQASENPFSAQAMDAGYMLAAADKASEGKCGEGKCGAAMGMGEADKAATSKPGTHAKSKVKSKAKSKAKAAEGKCGEGKCGAAMGMGGTDESKASESKASEGKCASAR
jgi:uncharacterized low-complexity protein